MHHQTRPSRQPRTRARPLWIPLLPLAGFLASGALADADSGPECREAAPRTKMENFNFRPSKAQLAFNRSLGEGLVIGQISYIRYNVFNLDDPREDNWIYRLADRINTITRESVIRNQLLFTEGEAYNPTLLAESERLLRRLDFLYDARVIPIRVCGNIVDLEVITRDVWTLNLSVSLSRSGGDNTSALGITDVNVLGTGKELGYTYQSDPDRNGQTVVYRDPALFGSRWRGQFVYSDNSDGYYRNVDVERPFFSVYERWSAGASGTEGKLEEATWYRGDKVTEFNHEYKVLNLFGGIAPDTEQGHRVSRWVAGIHLETNDFSYSNSKIPPPELPESRDYAYPFIGYQSTEDQFSKVRNMNYIGRTEDFHTGQRYSWSLGWSTEGFGATRDELALNASYENTLLVDQRRMWRLQGLANGYLRTDDGEFENLWFTLSSDYFFRQHHKWTFFANTRIDFTDGLTSDKQVVLGGENGLRGYERNYQVGDRSFVVNLEERYYSDLHPLRLFRVGGAIFVDVGRAWYDDQPNGANGGVLMDAGIGLRLNSSRAAKRRVIHVDLAFPLTSGDDVDSVQLLFKVRERF